MRLISILLFLVFLTGCATLIEQSYQKKRYLCVVNLLESGMSSKQAVKFCSKNFKEGIYE